INAPQPGTTLPAGIGGIIIRKLCTGDCERMWRIPEPALSAAEDKTGIRNTEQIVYIAQKKRMIIFNTTKKGSP
ncbi:MAG: hypothetical protein C0618_00670, partial [Desulfuromonas sp.]